MKRNAEYELALLRTALRLADEQVAKTEKALAENPPRKARRATRKRAERAVTP